MTAWTRRLPLLVAMIVTGVAAVGLGDVLVPDEHHSVSARPESSPTVAASGEPTTTSLSTTTATTVVDSTSATSEPGPTTTINEFLAPIDASTAAEESLGAYIESQFDVVVTDPACSLPATAAIGDQFVCYGLKPGGLVIAFRATIGDERLVSLELLTDQQPTTTTAAPTTLPALTTTTTSA